MLLFVGARYIWNDIASELIDVFFLVLVCVLISLEEIL